MAVSESIVNDLPRMNLLLAGLFESLDFDLKDQSLAGQRMVTVEPHNVIGDICNPETNLLTAITGSDNLSSNFNMLAGRQFLQGNLVYKVKVTFAERVIR